jgi:hypothetical protein
MGRGFVALSAQDKKCPVSYPAGRQRRWATLREAAHVDLFGAARWEIFVSESDAGLSTAPSLAASQFD